MILNTAFIGIGANLGNALQQTQDAITSIKNFDQIHVKAVSSFYQTEPIDSSGNDYINAVICIETSLDPLPLLDILFQIENHFGRKRPYVNAPRTLDLDLLLFNDLQINTPRLILPHPRMHERAFVLIPLIEICPNITIPNKGAALHFIKSVSNQRISRI